MPDPPESVIVSLVAECDAYRECLRSALGLLHEADAAFAHLQRRHTDLRDELRRYIVSQIGVSA